MMNYQFDVEPFVNVISEVTIDFRGINLNFFRNEGFSASQMFFADSEIHDDIVVHHDVDSTILVGDIIMKFRNQENPDEG